MTVYQESTLHRSILEEQANASDTAVELVVITSQGVRKMGPVPLPTPRDLIRDDFHDAQRAIEREPKLSAVLQQK